MPLWPFFFCPLLYPIQQLIHICSPLLKNRTSGLWFGESSEIMFTYLWTYPLQVYRILIIIFYCVNSLFTYFIICIFLYKKRKKPLLCASDKREYERFSYFSWFSQDFELSRFWTSPWINFYISIYTYIISTYISIYTYIMYIMQ